MSARLSVSGAHAWRARAVALIALLDAHGASTHEVRADCVRGRFTWVGPDGSVSAMAPFRAICAWYPAESALAMAWTEPRWASSSMAAVDSLPPSRQGVDEEEAFQVAMSAAEALGAQFLYRLNDGEASVFLALDVPRFGALSSSTEPHAPVAGVLSDLAFLRRALGSPETNVEGLCGSLAALGTALCELARSTYGGSDWVARLERSGKRLERLAAGWSSPRHLCFVRNSSNEVGVAPLTPRELDRALEHLEDEWRAFARRSRI